MDQEVLATVLGPKLDDDEAVRLIRRWLLAVICFSDETQSEYTQPCSLSAIELCFADAQDFGLASDRLLTWLVEKGVDALPFWDVCLAIQYRLDGDAEYSAVRIKRLLERCRVTFRQLAFRGGPELTDLQLTEAETKVLSIVREHPGETQSAMLTLLEKAGQPTGESTLRNCCTSLVKRNFLARHPSGKGYVIVQQR